jgi:hypothetical protein
VSPSLPAGVIDFIQQHIHSVLQLEVLLLLRERGGDWTPAAVAEELRITEESAELRLRDLQLRGLLTDGSAPESYAYRPQSDALGGRVDALADAYNQMKYTVINLIFLVPGDSARSLAEAFRIRRRKDE